MNYRLTMSTKQARLIVSALEHYIRTGFGHWSAVAQQIVDMHAPPKPGEVGDYCKTRDVVRGVLESLRPLLMSDACQSPNCHYGVGSPHTHSSVDLAYEIECIIRKAIAEQEQHDSWSVWHNDPISFTGEPFAKCEPITDGASE